MASKNGGGKVARALAAGLGLAAAMSVSSADAATSVGDIAASDNRLFIILGLFLPAIGWVLFNMAVSFPLVGNSKSHFSRRGKTLERREEKNPHF
jgi:hypothetical protein